MYIQLASVGDLDAFFIHVQNQFDDNGMNGSPLFMPNNRGTARVNDSMRFNYEYGIGTCYSDIGWRRVWLAKDDHGKVMGDAVLKRDELETSSHRVWLGMGVARECRGCGVGTALLKTVIDYARRSSKIKWLDLEVLADNSSAIHLYQNQGFDIVCKLEDKYRIDGESISEYLMTKHVDDVFVDRAHQTK
ncbi:GNAT family N-acetyltransferase [Vibrio sp. CAIM 722]|uniref:N-alpha-acetyltransferase 60 n=1 Tax=Vibrio eleionomae TaxID=2653505 RepID=A0A7X4LLS6_9VIBR|nr:GNAT family N-acetyltransferase [Vibrio eleionomae]MZI94274.1 GNAT family N-acetyltransferase [Vibrio eleionomae]